jgi:putative ABC transport system permease protein
MILAILKTAIKTLTANKMRSFLTTLGIIIGISSVVLVMSIGAGAQKLIVSEVSKVGTDLVGVLPGKSEEGGPPAAVFGQVATSLKKSDAEAISGIESVEAVSSYVTGRKTVSYGREAELFDITGVSESYPRVENTSLDKGYFFTERQKNSFSKVAVLGGQVEDELFSNTDAVGKNIKIQNNSFKVIGIMEERGAQLFGNLDSQVFIPVTTAQKVILGIDHVNFIRAKVASGYDEKLAEMQIEELLRRRHNISDPSKDDFTVRSMKQLLSVLESVTGAIQGFLVMVVAISLLVGGIGIMNIMLVSLSERIREVGIRKALGATDRNIMIQFLAESSLLAFLGGVIGVVGGIALGLLGSYLIRAFAGLDWQFVISFWQIILAAAVALIVGLVFGLYPAYRAAKLSPIDALRYE